MSKENNGDITEKHRRELVDRLKENSAFRIAYEDPEFLADDLRRAVRLGLELDKPEMILRRSRIRTSIVVFGSARTMAPDEAKKELATARALHENDPDNAKQKDLLLRAENQLKQSGYYAEARRFSQIVSGALEAAGRYDLVVFTGGGPGIMEAANRGAYDVGAMSAGLNITLPEEQEPNPFITPELCFHFHYFAIRKMHFLLRAIALVAFPGGYGTMDELFEALTLVQTKKMRRIPIVLVGSEFWKRAIDFDFLAEEGVIGSTDRELFHMVDTAEDAVETILEFYGRSAPDPHEFF